MATAREFVGKGWSFPLRMDSNGGVALVSEEREIEESMRLILGTAYGERPMRPEFGCAIHDFVFAVADSSTAAQLAHEVRASLRRWEPRISLEDVEVTISDEDRSVLFIDIRYSIKDSNDRRNLVFPFYVIPEEG